MAQRRGHKFRLLPVGEVADARACLDLHAYIADNHDLQQFDTQRVRRQYECVRAGRTCVISGPSL